MGDDGIYIKRIMYGHEIMVRPSKDDIKCLTCNLSQSWTTYGYFAIIRALLSAGFAILLLCSAAIADDHYLVSEPWCRYCPAAKAKFKAAGHPEENILTLDQCQARFGFRPGRLPYEFTRPSATKPSVPSPAQKQEYVSAPTLPRHVMYGNQVIDLETYSRNCNCGMCQWIRGKQREYQSSKMKVIVRPSEIPVPQPKEPDKLKSGPQAETPDEMLPGILSCAGLTADSVFCDAGCGLAKSCIMAAQLYGCRAVGVEIDKDLADEARERVEAAGLSERITIICMDVRDFDFKAWGVTVVYVYQYSELLEQLSDNLKSIGTVLSPFHEVPGLSGVWVYHGN